MAVLGFSSTEEDIYRHFLRHPYTSCDDVHLAVRTDRDGAQRALERLRELRALQGEESRLWATEPTTLIPRLAEGRLERLHREMLELTHTHPITAALERDRPAQTDAAGPAAPGIERIEDLALVRGLIDDLAFFARTEVLSAEPYDALSPHNIEHARPLDLRCLRRGVRIRNLVRRTALCDAPTVGYLREIAAHGAEVRVAEDFSELILVYDRHTALVPVDPRDTARGALCAREGALVGNIITLFERLWADAENLGALVDAADPDAPELSTVQREVLHCMCSVSKDEVGARKLGVSLRTYRRHIADLMHLLDSDNRAQAALAARERGWI
ncbi:response regulator transcription factor [Streptomyces sp. TRM49041]|uniref:response regulator transcription factor n=1 Tax=Streptomyces sp. TRM49041 TaxID=2603216 RepID=UPI0011EC1D14|nr:response regulator transcription factor [Streptomyces sp. TRM49041]